METLFKDKYSEMNFDMDTRIHYHIPYPSTANMVEDEFKDMILTWQKSCSDAGALYVIVDSRNLLFPIRPGLQEWVASIVASLTELRKAAFIMPEEFIANLGIEQYIDESNERGHRTRYFPGIEQAEIWVMASEV